MPHHHDRLGEGEHVRRAAGGHQGAPQPGDRPGPVGRRLGRGLRVGGVGQHRPAEPGGELGRGEQPRSERRVDQPAPALADVVYVLSANAYVAAQLGERDESRRLLRQLVDDHAGGDGGQPRGLLAADAELTAAWLAAADGQFATAVGALRALPGRVDQATTITVECLHLLSRLEPIAATAERLARVAAECDSPLFALWADYAHALAADDPAALERVGTALEASGYLALGLEAVIAAETASGHRGDHRRANLLARRADLLRERCGGYRGAGQCSALQGGGESPRWEGRQGPSRAVDLTSADGDKVITCGAKGSSGSSKCHDRHSVTTSPQGLWRR
ncbi:hypothetical protein AB0H57_31290 [Micromonospora sp. NPDC050686]|uniref:hypothetical protein n=1 Tax=Micromonospora sp. NPDC050686 TaxID=3154631 RepID=UPI0033E7E58C